MYVCGGCGYVLCPVIAAVVCTHGAWALQSMLGAGLPFQQLPWLQPCPYKLQFCLQVQVLLQLLNCCNGSISIALVVEVALLSAWSSICSAILVVLPG